MKKLNHLKTFESFNTNEEFNPFKKDDWKSAGTAVRKGVGFLTPEEEIEEGQKLVTGHRGLNKVYQHFIENEPEKVEPFLIFWSKNKDEIGRANPIWDGTKFVDKAKRYSNFVEGS